MRGEVGKRHGKPQADLHGLPAAPPHRRQRQGDEHQAQVGERIRVLRVVADHGPPDVARPGPLERRDVLGGHGNRHRFDVALGAGQVAGIDQQQGVEFIHDAAVLGAVFGEGAHHGVGQLPERVLPDHILGVDALDEAMVAVEALERDVIGGVASAVEETNGDDAAGAILPVDVVGVDLAGGAFEILAVVFEHRPVGDRHDPSVEPDHEPGHEQGHEQVGPQQSVERDPTRLQGHQLHRLRQLPGQVDAREEQGQRRDQPDNLGNVAGIVDRVDFLHRRLPVEEVVDVLQVVEQDEKDDQGDDQVDVPGRQTPNDMPVEGSHAV